MLTSKVLLPVVRVACINMFLTACSAFLGADQKLTSSGIFQRRTFVYIPYNRGRHQDRIHQRENVEVESPCDLRRFAITEISLRQGTEGWTYSLDIAFNVSVVPASTTSWIFGRLLYQQSIQSFRIQFPFRN